ncbi:MAG: hypothetical protein J7K04_11610 [Spirochaetales bacterium]|nr:hypothetical protein [Spirochaetales bacterium]
MFPIAHTEYPNRNLKEAYKTKVRNNMQSLIVVADDNQRKMIGMIELHGPNEIMQEETIKLRQLKF